MKKITLSVFLFLVIGSFQTQAQSKKALKADLAKTQKSLDSLNSLAIPQQKLLSLKDSFSYALAVDLYENNLAPESIDTAISADAFYLGFRAAELGIDTFPSYMRQAIIQQVFGEINARKKETEASRQAEQEAMGQFSLEKGNAFLAENAKKKDVVTLANGMQYKVMTSGDKKSVSPSPTSTVTVHYHGTFIDGKVFDSSYDRGQSTSFPVNGVIKGWTEILQLMHKGDKWEVYIPANLAYGKNGNGRIGPNETLVFIIELLDIK